MASPYGKAAWGVAVYSYVPVANDVIITGDLAPQTALGALLMVDTTFAGNIAPSVILTASMLSGPLWTPSELCPDPGWEETECCSG